MKPLKLTIEGINSFIAERTVDFERLSEDGIFCICGPTGSGKTTVLDCIILALYAPSSHNRGFLKDYINTKCDKGKITLDFTADGKTYRVYREFRRNSSSAARLTDLGTGEVLADKADSVTERIQSMLKLSKDDFTKVVVLEQGKFAEFMQMRKSNRCETVAKLFELERFERLKKTFADAKTKYDKEVGEVTSALMQYEGVTESALAELKKTKAAAEKEYAGVKKEKERIENELKQKESLVKAAAEREAAQNNIAKATAELEKAAADKEVADKKRADLGELKERLVTLKKGSDDAKIALSKIAECEADIEEAKKLSAEREKCLEVFQTEKENAEKLCAKSDCLTKSAGELREQTVAAQEKLSQLGYPPENTSEAAFAAVRANAESEAKRLSEYEKKLSETEKNIVDLETNIQKAIGCINVLRQQHAKAERDFTDAKAKYESESVKNASAAVRASMHDGDCCPVCGGVYHEESAPHCDSAANLSELKAACDAFEGVTNDIAKDLREKEIAHANLVAMMSGFKSARAESIAAIGGKNADSARLAAKAAGDGVAAAKALSERETELRDVTAKAEQSEKERDRILGEGKKLRGQIDALIEKIKSRLGDKSPDTATKLARAVIEEYECEQKRYDDGCAELTKSDSEITERTAAARTVIDAETRKLQSVPEGTISQNEIDALKGGMAAAEDKLAELNKQIGGKLAEVENLKERLEKKKELSARKKELSEKLDNILKINKCVAGENKLLSYVAEEYVQSFTYAASETLFSLSGGKYTLVYDNGDFYVLDFFADNSRRKVKTLSGGETFLASVSIAMAISREIATQNYEFFFLDEGFGTLHERAMETVSDALMKLAQETTVGIVTHRTELSERIPARLNVIPATEDEGSDVTYSTGG